MYGIFSCFELWFAKFRYDIPLVVRLSCKFLLAVTCFVVYC